MGVARWALLWAALILLPCIPVLAQDDGNGASQGQYGQVDEGQATCPGATEVATLGPTTDNSERQNAKITGETFRVTYDVEVIDRNDFFLLTIDVSGRFGEGPLVFVEETDSNSFLVTESPGNFDITVTVDEPDTARYTVTVEDCRGTDNNDPGGAADPDDVMPGTAAEGDLPNTGGAPLPATIFAIALLVASATLLRASVRRGP